MNNYELQFFANMRLIIANISLLLKGLYMFFLYILQQNQMKFQFEPESENQHIFLKKNQIKQKQSPNIKQAETKIQEQIANIDSFLNVKLKEAVQANKILKRQTRVLYTQAQNAKKLLQRNFRIKSQQKFGKNENYIKSQQNDQLIVNQQIQSKQKQENTIKDNKVISHVILERQQFLKSQNAKKNCKNRLIKSTIMSQGYPSVQKNASLGYKTDKMPYRFTRFS